VGDSGAKPVDLGRQGNRDGERRIKYDLMDDLKLRILEEK